MIDTLSGENRILRTDILHDAGAFLNPTLDVGQIEGGFVQGAGWLTMEELVWDAKGALKTHAPSTCKILCASDAPDIFNVAVWDAPNREDTIHRSKAVGEPPFMFGISVFSALGNACAATWAKLSKPSGSRHARSHPRSRCSRSRMSREIMATVSATRGSTPREASATMHVSPDNIDGTIGCGALEREAIRIACSKLAEGTMEDERTFPLGPDLSQCRGGAITLDFSANTLGIEPTEPPLWISGRVTWAARL